MYGHQASGDKGIKLQRARLVISADGMVNKVARHQGLSRVALASSTDMQSCNSPQQLNPCPPLNVMLRVPSEGEPTSVLPHLLSECRISNVQDLLWGVELTIALDTNEHIRDGIQNETEGRCW